VACYEGPLGTAGVGLCKGGLRTCNAEGTAFSACEGQVLPAAESCAAGATLDEDCDGQTNEDGAGCTCAPGAFQPCYDNGLNSPQLQTANGLCVAGVALCKPDGTGYDACQGQVLPGAEVCDEAGVDEDCDGQSNEGGAGCECVPGAQQACWEGPANAVFGGTSVCKQGTRTCQGSGKWGGCQGQVLPGFEPQGVCTANIDEDCNGDNLGPGAQDLDGDGWTACGGDCCETTAQCSDPKLVNPGAFEVVGNNLDDDCDAATSDTQEPPLCSTVSKFATVTPDDMAKAMDICQTTTLAAKKWGLISAQFLLANGSVPNATQLSNMQNNQGAILQDYGTGGVVPQKGTTMAGLSSGKMRDQNDPGYAGTSSGYGSSSTPPAAYLAANGGNLQSSAGCSGNCPAGSGANDSLNLRLQIRVPTNAKSFDYQFRFFSSEYWSWQCTQFNDFYLTQLISGAAGIPASRNISFDSLGNPVSVNNGFFQHCAVKGCNTCPLGLGALAGTGMQLNNTGGGTTWLNTNSPIVPGEVITLDLMIFDVSDGILDSLVLLDNFRWSLNASSGPSTGPL
jgi:hypothetical protein